MWFWESWAKCRFLLPTPVGCATFFTFAMTASTPVLPAVTRELCERLLYYLELMREIENRIELKLYRQGKILGGCYTGRGQEAIPVGSAILAEKDDWLCPTHRDMGVFLVRGMQPRFIFAQYLGRAAGPTRGRDGNMHMGDLALHLVPIISSIGASVPVASGIALALKYRRTSSVVFSYFGDGATSRGDWHEGVNFAAVQKLPVVYICNNNQYAYSTPLEKQMAIKDIADRALGYGISAEVIDGNDVISVYEATKRALIHARGGRGPYMIECKSFRMTGHSAHDSADYVPRALMEEWSKKDPILMLQKYMVERAWATEVDFKKLHARILAEVEAAASWALEAPYPDPSSLSDGVYE
jgi:pyruvate dehydrogenase E1 component alpha subunit